jgi:hypothetical protein
MGSSGKTAGMNVGGWRRTAAILALALGSAGCLQIETTIKLNEDGSATVRERVFFSERLLDRAGSKRGELTALLGRERVTERMMLMAESATLVSHETREGGDGWMESVAVIAVPDINRLRCVSPWFAYGDYPSNGATRVEMVPKYKSSPYAGGPAGTMSVRFLHEKRPAGGVAPVPVTPLQQQVYRDMTPVIRDMLKGFRLRITFESYAPIFTVLGAVSTASASVDLLDVSDENLDTASGAFFANEEIMLEIERLDFGGPNVAANVHRASTLPAFFPAGGRSMWWSGADNIWFKPSKQLFDKYFVGKKLDYSEWQASPPEKHVPADFAKIGWSGWKEDSKPAGGEQAPAGMGGRQ